MELGESLEDTLKRETKEEIGIDLTDFELFGIYSGNSQYYKYPNGDEVFVVATVFSSRFFSYLFVYVMCFNWQDIPLST